MKSKEILITLVNELATFEAENEQLENEQIEQLNMQDFLGFLNSKYSNGSAGYGNRKLGGSEGQWLQDMGNNVETTIATSVSLMYRYAKGYIKKALQGSIIQTVDELTFLFVLVTFESLSKSELIAKNVMEKTSGIEVIKRLLNQELIHQFADENDKRSQRVAITKKGMEELMKIMPNMALVSSVVSGNLTATERSTLAYLLKKLDYHHHDIYINAKDASLEELARG